MMDGAKVDVEFVRDTYMEGHVIDRFAEAAAQIGLWNSERSIIEKYLRKTDRILDIGCGAGRTTIALDRMGYSLVKGIDLSAGMIERARTIAEDQKLSIDFVIGDALDLPYPDGCFDAAFFSFNGLMQIPGRDNRIKAMGEIRRVLRPEGKLIFTTHADRGGGEYETFWLEEKVRWENGEQDPRLNEFGDILVNDDGHRIYLHIPVRSEVNEEIEQSGFHLVEERLRSEICDERDEVLALSAECRFWVVEK